MATCMNGPETTWPSTPLRRQRRRDKRSNEEKEKNGMTTTITLNEDALIRQLKDVDRRLTRATDPYQTILSERGVALLQEYRDGLNEQLKASPKKKATVSEPDH